MDEKEKSWDFSFLVNGDEEKYCIHKAGGTTPVKYRLEADILTLTADNNNNNNNKIEKKMRLAPKIISTFDTLQHPGHILLRKYSPFFLF